MQLATKLVSTRRGTLIAALLMFRFLYHFLPFVFALGLFGLLSGVFLLSLN